jgi:hypothetical protein
MGDRCKSDSRRILQPVSSAQRDQGPVWGSLCSFEFWLQPNVPPNRMQQIGHKYKSNICLSKSWKPLNRSLKKPPEHDASSRSLQRPMHPRQLCPRGYWVNARSVALPLSTPTRSYTGSACYLLAHFHRPFPSPLYWFPMWPTLPPFLFLYSWVISTGGSVCTTCSCWFLASGFLYPEDGGDTFLRNVGSHKIYTAPRPRRRHSSSTKCLPDIGKLAHSYFCVLKKAMQNIFQTYNVSVEQNLSWEAKGWVDGQGLKLNSVAWVRKRTIPIDWATAACRRS